MIEHNSHVVVDVFQSAGFSVQLKTTGNTNFVETEDLGAFVMLRLFILNSPVFTGVSDYIITGLLPGLGALADIIGLNCALIRSL